jgi:HKD family nuclease
MTISLSNFVCLLVNQALPGSRFYVCTDVTLQGNKLNFYYKITAFEKVETDIIARIAVTLIR